MTRTARHSRFEIAGLTAALILTTGIGLAACGDDDDSDNMDNPPSTEMMDETPSTEMMDETPSTEMMDETPSTEMMDDTTP